MRPNFLTVNPEDNIDILKGLASSVRVRILKLLHVKGPLNVNDISRFLALPQSTVATNIQVLEEARLIDTDTVKAKKGHQKICTARFDEIIVRFEGVEPKRRRPHGRGRDAARALYQLRGQCARAASARPKASSASSTCRTSSSTRIACKAALVWFGRGYIEYKFPNNAKILKAGVESLEFSMELSSEVPGTNPDWPSDITLWVNGTAVGTWTSPGDFGDKRGVYTPNWWKLEGSQYGKLKTWRVGPEGTFIDGVRISGITIGDLDLAKHHSIRMRIGIEEHAGHPGGVNIFGKGFGNYDQDIVMHLYMVR